MDLNKTLKNKKTWFWLIGVKVLKVLVVLLITQLFSSCKISLTFNGASIDYAKTKSISIADFSNVAELVHPPLAMNFTEKLRDKYSKQTRLQLLKAGGDMHLEGEIVGYELTPMSIGKDTYSAETKLTVTINVRFTNHKNPEDDFEKKYTAYQSFDSNLMITAVQDELLATMIEDITDNIYNDTVAKW
jgi:hypothetical protein